MVFLCFSAFSHGFPMVFPWDFPGFQLWRHRQGPWRRSWKRSPAESTPWACSCRCW
jgi:hypothetical protein